MASHLNGKYGSDTAVLYLRDIYYNMREKIEPEHMDLIHRAAAAMEAEGVTPRIVPIRGGTDGAQLSWKGLPLPQSLHRRRQFSQCPRIYSRPGFRDDGAHPGAHCRRPDSKEA